MMYATKASSLRLAGRIELFEADLVALLKTVVVEIAAPTLVDRLFPSGLRRPPPSSPARPGTRCCRSRPASSSYWQSIDILPRLKPWVFHLSFVKDKFEF